MSRLEDVFDMPKKKEESRLQKKSGINANEMKNIMQIDSNSPAVPGNAQVDITVDTTKAARLNEFVQTRLAHIYELAEEAAAILVRDILHGDIDARVIEGTARILETSIKALAEMNQFNMFLQKKIADEGLRLEMERLKEQAKGGRMVMSRETILELAKEIDKNKNREPDDEKTI